jgi:aminopeptidase N
MYYKGHNMLHTLRQIINDDGKWREILRGLNRDFYHQIVTSQQIEEYIGKKSGLSLDSFFDQYLRDTRVPVLEYRVNNGTLIFRWANCLETFSAPVDVYLNETKTRLNPTTEFQALRLNSTSAEIKVDPNYYVYSFDLFGT